MSESNIKKFGKKELLLIVGILIVAGFLLLFNRFYHSKPSVFVEVSINGTVVEMLDLSKDQDMVIGSGAEKTNHLIIKDGEVWIEEASCPDKICVYQGKISRDGEMIVCLPNLMIARIAGEE